MASINPVSSRSDIELDPAQRSREIKAEAQANIAKASKAHDEFEKSLSERPVNPASRVGLNIDVKV